MGVLRRGLICLLLGVLAFGGCLLAGCSQSSGSRGRRPILPLPLPPAVSVHGDYVTRRLAVPKAYASAGRLFFLNERRAAGPAEPLVLLLHGLYQSPAIVEEATAATSFSTAHRFTLVYPIGVNEAWNAGGCCRRDSADDVGYLVDLVHYVSTLTPVDLHRVYIWGFSNGGMMAWRAVCQTRDVFAGAGVVDGALLVPCRTAVHVVDLHGSNDRTVPFPGGFSSFTHTLFPDSANERHQLAGGSTLQVVLVRALGHRWPPLQPGRLDALNVLWRGLRGYRVENPAAVSAPV